MLVRTVLLSSIFVGALGTVACSGSTAPEGGDNSVATGQAAAAQTAPIAPQAKGRVRLIADALATVSLAADQRTEIEQLAQAAETRRASTAQAHSDIALAVAAQIESGTLDRAALQPKIDAASSAGALTHPADRAAFERLHAILTPTQRSQFVDAMKASFKGQHKDHESHRARMTEWKTDLKLTDAQVDQIKSVLKGARDHDGHDGHKDEMHEHFGHGPDMLDSFANDHFVMDEVAPEPDFHARANGMGGHMLDMVEKVLPLLTPEQRSLAATKIRERVTAGDEQALPPF